MTEQDIPVDTETWNDEDEDSGPAIYVGVTVGDGPVNTSASMTLTGERTDEEVADAIVKAALASASMRGMGTWIALQQLLTDYGREAA